MSKFEIACNLCGDTLSTSSIDALAAFDQQHTCDPGGETT